MVFVLPQNACIPCNKKVYQWWDMKSKSSDIHIITDHLIFKETDGIWLDTISLRLAQHNPYVTKAFVMMVESGKVIDHFPIEPAEIRFLDSTLSMRLQTLKSTSL